MKIEVGKVYKCGDTFFVKIIEILDCVSSSYQYLGIEWDIKKDECALCPYIGRFSYGECGIPAGYGNISRNPKSLRHQLEEIEEQQEAVEMTVSEISKALGKQIKIVKENS